MSLEDMIEIEEKIELLLLYDPDGINKVKNVLKKLVKSLNSLTGDEFDEQEVEKRIDKLLMDKLIELGNQTLKS